MHRNKPSRNAFYYFMKEFRERYPRKYEGGLKEVAEAAGPAWEKLTPEQRRPYETKAKFNKADQRVVKYASNGTSIEVIDKRERERVKTEQRKQDDIDHTIQVGIENGRIASEMFYLIHVNYFCECVKEKRYIPAELAVARFTLGEGVKSDNVYHSIVKPGPLPVGYMFLAVNMSKDNHQIDPPGLEEESNLAEVFDGLMTFMKVGGTSSARPPLYVEANNKDAAESVLEHLFAEFGQGEDLFELYPLEYLFFALRNNCGEIDKWPSISMSRLELEKDVYDFCPHIACGYHDNSDVPNHCSRSHVIRVAYTICDNCCGDLGIQLIPGQHVPLRANIAATRPSSCASSVSTVRKSHRPQHFAQEDGDTDYFLSQRTESGLSMSETSSVSDLNDYAALGGYDCELNEADEWIKPKQRHRRNNNGANKPNDSQGFEASGSSNLHSTNPSSSSQNVDWFNTPVRHPVTMSAGWVEPSHSAGLSQNVQLAKGRGRNIAAKLNK